MTIQPYLPHRLTAVLLALIVAGVFAAGCDFLDPTRVENPQTTRDDLFNAQQPVLSALPGLRAQFARVVGSTALSTSVATDDYSINGTGLGGNDMDFPELVTPNTAVINSTGATLGIYWNLQELRALSDFVLEELSAVDPDASIALLAEAHYYRGMAFLMQAENFTAVPTERDGIPIPASELYSRAKTELEMVLNLDGGGAFALPAEAALARLARGTGDIETAATLASAVLASDPEFLFQQAFDDQNLVNAPHLFIVTRALKELQPLPRLDFLDPKYTARDAGIAVAKAEEMHLILAEVALVEDRPGDAAQHLQDALDLVADRPTTLFSDNDPRFDNDLNPRPRTSDIAIAFEPGGDFVEGLVLDRPCSGTSQCINTPDVSGTSVTEDQLAAADADELVRLLYLMRQEIMLLEGRRLHDLGLRFPMMLREIEQNPNIAEGDPGTEMVIPAYIPPGNELDLYTPVEIYDEDGNTLESEITMLHDMNRVLATQRGLLIANPQVP